MGMFDDIRVDYPIPGVEPFDAQTKELVCCREKYRIDESGQLLIQELGEYDDPHWVPQNNSALLSLEPDDNTTVLIYLLDGRVKDVTVKRECGNGR